jgi:putative ABC transport system permease protein
MLFLEIIKVAMASLRANVMRSSLTMLGVIIGVAAVIAMVALGEGAQARVQEQLSTLGANRLTVRAGAGWFSGGRDRGARLSIDDARAVQDGASAVATVVPVLERNATVEYGNLSSSMEVIGTWVNWPRVNGWELDRGRFFTEAEQEGRRRLAVIGSEVAEDLFPEFIDPIGSSVRLNGVQFEVIGVLAAKGDTGFRNQDDTVVVPLSTAQYRLFGTEYLSSFVAEATTERQVTMATAEVESILRRQHRLRPTVENDFTITGQTEFLNLVAETGRTFTLLLAGIAGVSLVVGGIGIMNIMLVSVTERTREIGLRKALGATKRSIRLQFLIEAVVLSSLGGALGVTLGSVAASAFRWRFGWHTVVSPDAVPLAFGFSAIVGVLFGFYPAFRASRLDPIVALRFE